ncbi:RNA-binding protein 26 isoform X2 [Rhinatrema bivittatum]|uniref:RNA-binding protein 26 isoform X2 n=1 Tax=Rhinatrema bivittatum TaxID=194408 RepID=UPI00112C6A89|nr:RNA-binding protein 26 isoform X2 [Rhinatrema bivittatum]
MMIENFEALKNWLSKTLEPICDADPSALANYVLALVKKDKSEKELKASCIDQLDVFLQKETQTFVDKLFDAVNTKSYLPQPEVLPSGSVKIDFLQQQEKEIKKEEVTKEEEREKKFSRRLNHSPQQSSSRYRENRSRDDRKKDDRSRKRDYDRNPPRRDSYRDRYNRRRGRSRSYSRSRSRSRSWSKERLRDRDRDRSRSRSRSRTRSRERDSGKPKYDLDRTDPLENSYTAASSLSNISSSHYPVPTLSSTITVIAPSHHGNSTTENWSDFHEDQVDHSTYGRPPPPKKRCRDYDEQGFCMRGDMCPFDHGSDPVVVEDVNLPGILPFPAQPPVVEGPPPPGLPPPPPILTPPPVNLRPPVPPPGPLPPSLPPVTGPPPPLPPLQPSGMDAPPNSATSSVPTVVTSGIHHPPPGPPPLFTPETYDTDGYNPEAPSITNTSRPLYRHRVHAQRSNLIGLTSGDMDLPPREKPTNNNSVRIVVDSESRKRTIGSGETGAPPKKAWFDKQNFNRTNSPGFQKKVPFGNENTKLELRRIPPELNNISKLNEHFSRFGTLVNLQVAYNGDPEGALIQFATHEEAKKAISSTEAVLNNRFIKVYWHREGTAPPMQTTTQKVVQSIQQPTLALVKQSVKERLGPVPSNNVEPAEAQNAGAEVAQSRRGKATYQHAFPQRGCRRSPDLLSRLSRASTRKPAYKREPIDETFLTSQSQNVTKLSVKERLGFVSKPATATTEKVLSTSTGLTKTVYNPAALKALQKSLPILSATLLDNTDAQKKKQEALRLQQDVRKKKQEILEKHIETQKILISRLEKNKAMKSEDKAEIMKTLETLSNSITKLKDELKAISSGSVLPKSVKTKAQMQKELLDTELDLYKKIQAGEDVAELRRKYTELQLEAAKRGILSPSRGRGSHARGRGVLRGRSRGRGLSGRGRGVPVHAVVDHRPRALEISSFTESDREDLLPHFAQFGEIEDCQIDDSSLHAVITFKTRAQAEAAAIHGARFKGQDLKLAWNKPATNISTVEMEEVDQDEEEFQEESIVDDSLLQDDDEEEEDNESRSWRR